MTRLGDRVMPRWLEDAGHLIVEHLGDAAYDLAALAQACGVSPSHLSHSFIEGYGEAIASFRQRMRLVQAARLLRDQLDCPIHQVAHRCGYRNASSFSREFRHHFGLSPRRYRSATEAVEQR